MSAGAPPDEPLPTLGVREGYDRWAEFYDDDGNPLPALEERHVPALIGDAAGLDVADIGAARAGMRSGSPRRARA